MKSRISLTCELNATTKQVFDAWLDSEKHSAMTGGNATCSCKENEPFSAWDGYIHGTNKVIEPYKKIVQNWRTTEFAADDSDSELTIDLIETDNGCRLTLTHINIPEGQSDYEKGWIEHYFEPMTSYFRKQHV